MSAVWPARSGMASSAGTLTVATRRFRSTISATTVLRSTDLAGLDIDARDDAIQRRGELHLGNRGLRRGEFGACGGETLIRLLLRLHGRPPEGEDPALAIDHLLGKHERMPRLVYRGLGDSVVEFDHDVAGLDALALDDVDRNHDTGDRRGELRAAAGMPGLGRLRLHHAVGLDPRAQVGFRYRPDLNGDFGLDLSSSWVTAPLQPPSASKATPSIAKGNF